MTAKSFYRFGALVLLLMLGCTKSELPDDKVGCKEDYGSIMVNLNTRPLFADVSGYDWNPGTKSAGEDNYSTLESLLDRSLTEVGEVGSYFFTCIPLKEEVNDKWIYLSNTDMETVPADSLTRTKIYVIIAENLETGEIEDYVTTLIPDKEYTDYFDLKDLRYLERGNFSGLLLFSDIYGQYLGCEVIPFSEPIMEAGLLSPDEEITGDEINLYIGTYGFITKADWEEELEPSICIGKLKVKTDDDDSIDDEDSPGRSHGGEKGGGSSGSTSPKNSGSGSGGSPSIPKVEQQLTHNVNLSASGEGVAVGGGKYLHGSMAYISASPRGSSIFGGWRGNLNGSEPNMSIVVNIDINATAYFFPSDHEGQFWPCADAETGKANPMVIMTLAPTATGNIAGATYGMTRNAGKTKHNGIDFFASIGTPVYSMYDGIITKIVSEQPDRVFINGEFSYPPGYSGDKDGSGNRIYITSTIDGNSISMGYWHLQAGNAVAINPRTGIEYAVGDRVYQGEIIGYTGQSGNAIGVPNKHLHLSAQRNGAWCDPAPYINGKVSTTNVRITGIKCDE